MPLTEGYRSITVRPAAAWRSHRQRPFHRPRRARDRRRDCRHHARRRADHRLVFADAGPRAVRVPPPRRAGAVSRRLASAQRPGGWKRPLWIAQDALAAAPVRRFPVAGASLDGISRARSASPNTASSSVPHAVDNEMFAAAAAPLRRSRGSRRGAQASWHRCRRVRRRCLSASWWRRSGRCTWCAPPPRSDRARRCHGRDRVRSKARCAPKPRGSASI